MAASRASARRVGGSAQAARGLPLPLFCQCGRSDLRTCRHAATMSALGAKPADICSLRAFRFWRRAVFGSIH